MLQRLDGSRGVRQVNVVLELFGWLVRNVDDILRRHSDWQCLGSDVIL